MQVDLIFHLFKWSQKKEKNPLLLFLIHLQYIARRTYRWPPLSCRCIAKNANGRSPIFPVSRTVTCLVGWYTMQLGNMFRVWHNRGSCTDCTLHWQQKQWEIETHQFKTQTSDRFLGCYIETFRLPLTLYGWSFFISHHICCQLFLSHFPAIDSILVHWNIFNDFSYRGDTIQHI